MDDVERRVLRFARERFLRRPVITTSASFAVLGVEVGRIVIVQYKVDGDA